VLVYLKSIFNFKASNNYSFKPNIMKKLRLLFTTVCNRSCEGCCNKDWQLDKLPTVQHFNYEEILITGGEPLLDPSRLKGLIQAIRVVSNANIYIYTALVSHDIYEILGYVDGVTITLHNQSDVNNIKPLLSFVKINEIKNKSLRLNIFKGININDLDLTGWEVKKDIEWIKECPLPKDEEFMKLN
jgi:MoaA/NifB/PqqE/SkfB family radical SAM enzyme